MVKHTQGSDRNAVFQVLVNRIGTDRLANTHAVLLIAQVIPKNARNTVDDLAHAFGLVRIPSFLTDRSNRDGCFAQFGCSART